MDDNDRKSIIPLSRLANSVGSSLFEGNDRDLAWDREIPVGKNVDDAKADKERKTLPKEIGFISFDGKRSMQQGGYG